MTAKNPTTTRITRTTRPAKTIAAIPDDPREDDFLRQNPFIWQTPEEQSVLAVHGCSELVEFPLFESEAGEVGFGVGVDGVGVGVGVEGVGVGVEGVGVGVDGVGVGVDGVGVGVVEGGGVVEVGVVYGAPPRVATGGPVMY